MKVVICFPAINPYMASCWRALASKPGISLHVIAHLPDGSDLVGFDDAVMGGLSFDLLSGSQRHDLTLAAKLAHNLRPDVLVISGWSTRPFRRIYFDARLQAVPKVMVMDNQLRRTFRQHLARIALGPILRRIEAIWVTGERSWQYGRFLGMPESRLFRGAVGVDAQSLDPIFGERQSNGPWPKVFFFAGRYHHRKALDILVTAYREYRTLRSDPWALTTAGMGPAGAALRGVEGVRDLGFLGPELMADAWRKAGVFVLPSRFDAWPLAIVEAAASGLPVIASEECGSTVETVRHLYSGLVVPAEDSTALAQALAWMHDRYDYLPTMGTRGQQLAAAYGAEMWAEKALEIIAKVGKSEKGR